MWTPKQKAWLHQMKSVAGVADAEYRAQMQAITGCNSAADERLTNTHFEQVMCWLEIEICKAIANEIVTPSDVLNKIADPWSFHRRRHANSQGSPSRNNGKSNGTEPTRKQLDLIDACRKDLCAFEPQFAQWSYIQSIIHNGAFGPAPDAPEKLTRDQASKLINALKEKMSRYESSETMRRPNLQGMLQSAEVSYENKDPLPF